MKRDALYAVPQKEREAEPMCPATAVKRARASNDKKDRRIRVLKQGGSANEASCFNHIGWENVFNYSISFYRLVLFILIIFLFLMLIVFVVCNDQVKDFGIGGEKLLIFTLDGLMVFIQWIL
ncbi:hypothetical protein HanPI659440_Chr08g0279391 [Helianthus annuus]|nr:hypothetical protein HanPI659440_Chr08g0279391 [Helianthus annuus]